MKALVGAFNKEKVLVGAFSGTSDTAKLGEGFAQGIHTQFQLMEESDKLGVDDPEDP